MARCLVTGHRGYIGSHLYESLVNLKHEVIGVDLKDGEDVLHCLPNEKFDYVFHLAACPRVEYSVEHPSYIMKQNVLVTSTLLEWAKNHGDKRESSFRPLLPCMEMVMDHHRLHTGFIS